MVRFNIALEGFWRFFRDYWDEPSFCEWVHEVGGTRLLFKVSTQVFDENGNLKPILVADWDDNLIRLELSEIPDVAPATDEQGLE